MNFSQIKTVLKTLKWSAIGVAILSGWLTAAWIKTSVTKPVTPVEIQRTLEVKPLPPAKGDVVVTLPCVPVQVQIPKSQAKDIHDGALSPNSPRPAQKEIPLEFRALYPLESPQSQGSLLSSTQDNQSQGVPASLFPLNLGSYKIPPRKDPQVYQASLDQSGLLTLNLLSTGGRFRLGGERYAYVDLITSNQREAGMLGFHQDLGRTWQFEWMIEAAAGLQKVKSKDLQTEFDPAWELRLRIALPF